MVKPVTRCTAIVCITVLTGYALRLGYDHALLALVVAAIAGLAGYRHGKSVS